MNTLTQKFIRFGAIFSALMLPLASWNVATATDYQPATFSYENYFERQGSFGAGHVFELDTQNTTVYAGYVCDVTVRSVNQFSVHEGNDVVVESRTTYTAEGVENEANKGRDFNGTVVLGDSARLTYRLGQTGKTSLKVNVHLQCTEPQFEVCRSDEVITIYQGQYDAHTDTDAPCPVVEDPDIAVCREGYSEPVTIKESEFNASTDTSPVDGVCPTDEQPEEPVENPENENNNDNDNTNNNTNDNSNENSNENNSSANAVSYTHTTLPTI